MRHIPAVLLVAATLLACAAAPRTLADTGDRPINLIPMYGAPEIEKTEQQKQADKVFIETVTRSIGSREAASREFAGRGWYYLQQGDAAAAMRRFNQSWLLRPGYYMPYWGFAVLSGREGRAAEALSHYERALSLIGEDEEKPRLLGDAARTLVERARAARLSDPEQSAADFAKADAFIEEALRLDPQFGAAYRVGARSYFEQGRYDKAWELIKRSRAAAPVDFPPGFIEALSGRMPEPD